MSAQVDEILTTPDEIGDHVAGGGLGPAVAELRENEGVAIERRLSECHGRQIL